MVFQSSVSTGVLSSLRMDPTTFTEPAEALHTPSLLSITARCLPGCEGAPVWVKTLKVVDSQPPPSALPELQQPQYEYKLLGLVAPASSAMSSQVQFEPCGHSLGV
jgi:hypothetical protein